MRVVIDLQRAALEYLDTTGFLQTIKDQCVFYSSLQDRAYQFVIPIEPCDLLDLDGNLGNLVLNQPKAAANVFKEIVYTAISCLSLLPQCCSSSQVVISFKLHSLPNLPQYRLNTARDLSSHAGSRRYLQYEGVVCTMSTVHKYTKSARFVCPQTGCEGSEGDKYIRLHIPGAREAQTIRSDFTCTYCGTLLEEDISCRVLADRLVVNLVDELAFTRSPMSTSMRSSTGTPARHQSLQAYLRDDLSQGVEMGQKLQVIGLPVMDAKQGTIAIEVNTICRNPLVVDDFLKEPLGDRLPASIKQLWLDRKQSPWGFALGLAYAFAGEVAPAGSFLHLKLGLLLSLVGSLSKEGGGLDLLAVGSDSLVLHRLLHYAAEFAQRAVTHSPNSPLTAAVYRNKGGFGGGLIEGGSLLLAHHGVCTLPDLGTYSKNHQQALLQVLETGNVHVEVPSQSNHQVGQQLWLPRRCRIWGCLDPGANKKTAAVHLSSDNKLGVKQLDLGGKDLLQSLADVFGIVYTCEVAADSYADYMVIHQTLLRAMATSAQPLITRQDFEQLIHYARGQTVVFSVSAELLIQGYYVGSRRARSRGLSTWTIPITAVKTITSLSEAHAKLCLRQEVSEWDALMAVWLYEECATARSGYSVLNVQPMPHIKDNNIETYIGPERDKQLLLFYQVLKQFIADHALESDALPEE